MPSRNTTFTVRPLRCGDLWPVLAIERQAFPKDPWTLATAKGWLARSALTRHQRRAAWLAWFIRFARLNEMISLARLIRLIALGQPLGLCCLVAEEDAVITGYASLSAAAGRGNLQMIAVRAGRQGQGVGTALLTHTIATAAARGCREVFLYVRADNSGALRLYHRTGFTESGVQRGYYQPSGTDAIVMRLSIPAYRGDHLRVLAAQGRSQGRPRPGWARR